MVGMKNQDLSKICPKWERWIPKTEEAYISGIIEREREKMDKKKDLIQMLEKIQNPNHLAMVYGFVKRMYLEEQKERIYL